MLQQRDAAEATTEGPSLLHLKAEHAVTADARAEPLCAVPIVQQNYAECKSRLGEVHSARPVGMRKEIRSARRVG